MWDPSKFLLHFFIRFRTLCQESGGSCADRGAVFHLFPARGAGNPSKKPFVPALPGAACIISGRDSPARYQVYPNRRGHVKSLCPRIEKLLPFFRPKSSLIRVSFQHFHNFMLRNCCFRRKFVVYYLLYRMTGSGQSGIPVLSAATQAGKSLTAGPSLSSHAGSRMQYKYKLYVPHTGKNLKQVGFPKGPRPFGRVQRQRLWQVRAAPGRIPKGGALWAGLGGSPTVRREEKPGCLKWGLVHEFI